MSRPLIYDKPMRKVNVMLDEETIRMAKEFGGNMSDGIRRAVRIAYQERDCWGSGINSKTKTTERTTATSS